MKKITYILIASVLILTGCSDDFELNDNDQGLNVQFLPGKYVAFAAPGANATVAAESGDEGETVDLTVEIPTGTTSDVTVNYVFSGTAVFGTDFTVIGANASGGSVVIVPDDGSDPANLIDNADISVQLLTDGVVDGNKTLVVTLTSASNAEGDVLVGRAGTDQLRSQTVDIADID